MDQPIDAEMLYDQGTLRATTFGLVRRFQREGRPDDLVPLVGRPIAALADKLRGAEGEGPASDVLGHAVHDGVTPAQLMRSIQLNTAPPEAPPPPPAVSIGPSGELLAPGLGPTLRGA